MFGVVDQVGDGREYLKHLLIGVRGMGNPAYFWCCSLLMKHYQWSYTLTHSLIEWPNASSMAFFYPFCDGMHDWR